MSRFGRYTQGLWLPYQISMSVLWRTLDLALPNLTIWFSIAYLQCQQIIDFIQEHNIIAPNGTKPVTEVHAGDIVVLGRQLCLVIKVSQPFSSTLPMDFDKFANPKKVIRITGQSILWSKIEYDPCFVLHHDNKIGTFSGTPEVYEGPLVDIAHQPINNRAYLKFAF